MVRCTVESGSAMTASDRTKTSARKRLGNDPRGEALAFCVLIHAADGGTRLELVENGLPARMIGNLAALMGIPLNGLARVLDISTTTLRSREKASKPLSPTASDRIMGMARLIGYAALLVQETGGPSDFDAGRWIASWLADPAPALGGRCPEEFMSTRQGQDLVANLLEQAASGAYA